MTSREMENMIEGYINFASNAMAEETQNVDVIQTIKDSIASFKNGPEQVSFNIPDQNIPDIPLRKQSIRRTVDNIINNALQYSNQCEINIEIDEEQIQIIFDDNGPGIPKDQRTSVLRPFVRLNENERAEVD